MRGKLILVATPIDMESGLIPETKAALLDADQNCDLIAVEDLKPARRRWVSWGMPRETIDRFFLYNEHNQKESIDELMTKLSQGISIYLLSDAGLPAFCDPGQSLVERCHRENYQVTATPFHNSVLLALAMSGMDHSEFIFRGFLPVKKEERSRAMKKVVEHTGVNIVMDTPYRLRSLLEGLLEEGGPKTARREGFLACDLNKKNEWVCRASLEKLASIVPVEKKEFVLVLNKVG